ncbi:hypothetical protein SANTM175S_05044 [Streptomyces antimycoticus]
MDCQGHDETARGTMTAMVPNRMPACARRRSAPAWPRMLRKHGSSGAHG